MEAALGTSYVNAVNSYHEALYEVCEGFEALSLRGGRLLKTDEKLRDLHTDITEAVAEIGLSDIDLVIVADVEVLSSQNKEQLEGIKAYGWKMCEQVALTFIKIQDYTNRVLKKDPRSELIAPCIEESLCDLVFEIAALDRSALFIEKYIDAALKGLDNDCPPAQKKVCIEKDLSPPQVKRFKRDEGL